MATPSSLASDLRLGIAELSALAASDLRVVFGMVETPGQARDALMDLLPALIDTYGIAAAALAADWYDETREAAGIAGRFRAIPADIADSGAFALAGWATSTAADVGTLQSLVEGGMQRRIANFSRQTVMQSTVADPRAVGWQRVGAGECKTGFCDMLISRGAVYTEATVDFATHDHCQCTAVQAWSGQERPVKPYTPSLRAIPEADQQRARRWIADNL